MSRRDRYLFQKIVVSSPVFQLEPDIIVDLIDNQSLLFINESSGSVDVSFDGETVHAELNAAIGTGTLSIMDFPFKKIWLRLHSGVASTIIIQNNANVYSNNSTDVTIVAADGYQLSTPFADPFPGAGLAIGFNDGSEMQYARVYDTDTGLGEEFTLGTVLRASAPGGSVETGTSSNPLRTDPTGSTAQPVTDNGGSLTVDTTQLPAVLIGGRLDTNNGSWLGSTAPTVGQKAMVNSVPVVIASDQTAVPVSDNSGSLTVDTPQLPTALVGNRLDTNTGSWLGSTVPTVGQKTMTESIPVVVSSNQTVIPVSDNSGSLTVDTTQLPASLVGNRLDTNTGSWLGSTAPTVGQKTSDNSIPVVVSSDQSSLMVEPVDSVLDAFARVRVSSPITLFDGKNLYGNRALDYDEAFTGSGSAADVANAPLRRLTVTGNAADSAIRQTKRYFAYQAGKSHQVLVTFILGAAVANVRRRVGYFDGNNGVFLQQTSAGNSLVLRSSTSGSPSDIPVAQSSWNVDPMDGTGPSGRILDLSKSQILYIDLEWLGVGRVRCGFLIDGKLYYVHSFYTANVTPSVYTATAALPVRWEIANTAASAGATLNCNCASVASEGGNEYPGILTGIDRDISLRNFTVGEGTTLRPLLGIRANAANTRMTVYPESIEVLCTTNSTAGFKWVLLLNPTITGGAAANWTAVSPNSGLEYDITRSGVVSSGYPVASGYGIGNVKTALLQRNISLGATIAGVRDEYVLAVAQLTGATESYVAAMQMREIF